MPGIVFIEFGEVLRRSTERNELQLGNLRLDGFVGEDLIERGIEPGNDRRIRFSTGDESEIEDRVEPDHQPRLVGSGHVRRHRRALLDATTLVVTLKRRAVDLPYILSPIRQTEGQVVPKAYIEHVGEDEFRRNPIGSGPFEFVERIAGSKVTFRAQPQHWSYGPANYESFEALQVPEESTRLTMLRRGEVNVIDIPRRLVASLREETNIVVAPRVGDTTYTIWFTGLDKEGPLHDERVRRALSHAIDRDQIVQLFGGSDLARVAHRIGSCASWNDGCPASEPLPFDPQRAAELLREAGQANLEIIINTSGVYPEQQIVSEALAGFWGAIGMRAVVQPIDFGNWRAGFGTKTLAANSVFVNQQPNSVLSSSMNQFYSSASVVKMIAPADVDAYMQAAAQADSIQKQSEEAGKAAQLVFQQTYEIPLVESGQVLAFDKSIVNTTLGGRQYVDFGLREMLTRSGRA